MDNPNVKKEGAGEQKTEDGKGKEGGKPSYQDVVALLKDPRELSAAAARLGLTVVDPRMTRQDKKEEELKAPEMPEIPDDADAKTVKTIMAKAMKAQQEYMDKKIARETARFGEDLTKKEQARLAKEIDQFAKSHKYFQELLPDIDIFFAKGIPLEEAYKKACKLNDKDPEEGVENSPKQRNLKSSEGVDQEDLNLTETFKNPREAARANLAKMIAANPKAKRLIDGEAE